MNVQNLTHPETDRVASLHAANVMPTYAPERVFTRGKGSYLWDVEGKKYLDFVSGIAVTGLGHSHPAMVRAVQAQAARLMHCSNLYYNEWQPELAKKLCEVSLGGKVFFCNSGAEANEGMIKLARLWGSESGRYEIITLRSSFHGRTLATLTATGQDKVQKGFHPLPEGFRYANLDDIESIRAQLTEKTVAVMMEPLQAEGGVRVPEPGFVKEVRTLCDENNLLLCLDEVQTGVGRTGTWFGYQQTGVTPDVLSVAKGLGGGVPIGAVVASPKVADVLNAGTHGSTFGGNPLVSVAALTMLETIEKQRLLDNVCEMGDLIQSLGEKLMQKHAFINGMRGLGLLRGISIDHPCKALERICAENGLLTVATAGTVLRLLPPLTVSRGEVKKAMKIIDRSCEQWKADLDQ